MGTNYYLYDKPPCETCGRDYEDSCLHIGKSSAGWCFTLHVIPEEGINTLDDWRARWSKPGAFIRDEYGDTITVNVMEAQITQRRRGTDRPFDARWLQENGATVGPNGLARQRIGRHCIGHGDGTWDYCAGDFS